jgi:hypothetical protein
MNSVSLTDKRGAVILYDNQIASAVTSGADLTLTDNTYERYVLSSTSVNIEYNLLDEIAINCVCIGAHTLKGATVEVKANKVGSSPTHVQTKYITSNQAVMFYFDDVVAEEIAISITNAKIGDEIGVVYCGYALQMERPIYGGVKPFELNKKVEYQTRMSESGNFLGRVIKSKGTEASFTFKNLSRDFVRTQLVDFIEHTQTKPFFINWRPNEYDDTDFCYTTKPVEISNQGGGNSLMSCSISVRGAGQ